MTNQWVGTASYECTFKIDLDPRADSGVTSYAHLTVVFDFPAEGSGTATFTGTANSTLVVPGMPSKKWAATINAKVAASVEVLFDEIDDEYQINPSVESEPQWVGDDGAGGLTYPEGTSIFTGKIPSDRTVLSGSWANSIPYRDEKTRWNLQSQPSEVTERCRGAWAFQGPEYASIVGYIAHTIVAWDCQKALKLSRNETLYVDDQAAGGDNARYVRFLISRNAMSDADKKRLRGDRDYQRPDLVIHNPLNNAPNAIREFEETKPDSAAGRKAGAEQIAQALAWYASYHLPYRSGTHYLADGPHTYPILEMTFAGNPVKFGLKILRDENRQPGLVLYQYCVTADFKKLIDAVLRRIFIICLIALIAWLRNPGALPPGILPPGVVLPNPVRPPVEVPAADLSLVELRWSDDIIKALQLLPESAREYLFNLQALAAEAPAPPGPGQ